MPKRLLNFNVFEGAKQRIEYVFDHFEKIYVSFSGGKDSTVMLHLVMDEAIKRNKKVGVLFVDLEGQYKLTIDHIEACYQLYKDHIERFWVCLPIHLRNAVSVYEPFWLCWDPEQKESWIREQPKDSIKDLDKFPFFQKGMEFEEFVPEFGEWYSEGKYLTACFVGIRTDESLNRFRTIASESKETYGGLQWTTRVTENVFNIYPVYDWNVDDLWIYHFKTGKLHNKLYDMMHKAGLTLSQMRICQPYGDDQRKGLWLFHLIEPETWAKVVARVNGANGGALYIEESGNINGYRTIKKPNGHTWRSFAKLLISSMPPKTKTHYENKIAIFQKWWIERGYPEGIPDVADQRLEAEKKVPSWKRVCKSLLRNDYWCKGLGFSQHKSEAYEKYLKLMKKRRETWNLELF